MFNQYEFRYANGIFLQDSQLKNNLESFLQLFEGKKELESVSIEKGNYPGETATAFPNDSMFNVVEALYLKNYEAFICDDLGTEFADHIGLDQNRIAFFVEKCNDSVFSASAFQEVVAQAQKNLGSYNFSGRLMNGKISKLNNTYIYQEKGKENCKTGIRRIRSSQQKAADVGVIWRSAMKNVFLKKELFIVVNFLSRSDLKNHLIEMRRGKESKEVTNAKMILWLISSLAGSCKELNVDLHVVCKP